MHISLAGNPELRICGKLSFHLQIKVRPFMPISCTIARKQPEFPQKSMNASYFPHKKQNGKTLFGSSRYNRTCYIK
jgi:hypothetical protein